MWTGTEPDAKWIVYLFRWKLPRTLAVMEPPYHLRHHRRQASIRVVGIGRPSSTTDIAVETLKVTGCSKILALPGRELFLQSVVGNGRSKVTPQSCHSLGLRVTIGADDFEIATERRLVAARLPDLLEILQDLLSTSLPLVWGKTLWQVNSFGNIAQLVEETALLFSIKPNCL